MTRDQAPSVKRPPTFTPPSPLAIYKHFPARSCDPALAGSWRGLSSSHWQEKRRILSPEWVRWKGRGQLIRSEFNIVYVKAQDISCGLQPNCLVSQALQTVHHTEKKLNVLFFTPLLPSQPLFSSQQLVFPSQCLPVHLCSHSSTCSSWGNLWNWAWSWCRKHPFGSFTSATFGDSLTNSNIAPWENVSTSCLYACVLTSVSGYSEVCYGEKWKWRKYANVQVSLFFVTADALAHSLSPAVCGRKWL